MGARTRMVTACNYEVWEGLEILTDSARVLKNRRMTAELLLARCPEVEMLQKLAGKYGVKSPAVFMTMVPAPNDVPST